MHFSIQQEKLNFTCHHEEANFENDIVNKE